MSTETEQKLTKAILNHGLDILSKACVNPNDIESYIRRLYDEHLDYPVPKTEIDKDVWLIPESYKNLDIEEYLVSICPEQNYDRLITELELYRKNSMVPVLKAMKYIVDSLRENNIVWGVGRGSSVASYTLFLLGVHKVDSVKYNLPIEEFFKGE
jgi:DNA polymerase III alpha subunit